MRNITLTDVKQFAKRHDLYLGPATREGAIIFRSVRNWNGSLVLTYWSNTRNRHKWVRVPFWRGLCEVSYEKANTLHQFEMYLYGEDL